MVVVMVMDHPMVVVMVMDHRHQCSNAFVMDTVPVSAKGVPAIEPTRQGGPAYSPATPEPWL
jgi:hypothetical protein